MPHPTCRWRRVTAGLTVAAGGLLLAPMPSHAAMEAVRLTAVRTSDGLSSPDPAAPGMTPTRRDVDLASCVAARQGGDHFALTIHNAYPGYVCTLSLTTSRSAAWRIRVPDAARSAGFSVRAIGSSGARRTAVVAVSVDDLAPEAANLRFVLQLALHGRDDPASGTTAEDDTAVLGEILVRPVDTPEPAVEGSGTLAATGSRLYLLLLLSCLSSGAGVLLVAAGRDHRGSA